MRSLPILAFTLLIVIAIGLYALPHLNKNEFPSVAPKQAVVVVVYPGATAEEIEEQVAGKVEDYLFTFTDVDKTKTYSYSQNGMLYVFATLAYSDEDTKLTWSRIREGLSFFRLTSLPQGVAATAVIDDFGNASSLLLAIESNERSPRELENVAKQLSARLRSIKELGKISFVGDQKEEVAVSMDAMKLSQYAISPSIVTAELAAHGFRTISGKVSNAEGNAMVHVTIPTGTIYDLRELVVFADPVTGQTLRLRDVATVESRYEEGKPHIKYSDTATTENRCIMLSIEMRPGNNVVSFGEKVEEIIKEQEATLTPDIHIHRITDQPRVVDESVKSFLKDLIEAILIVILVMLILFPLSTALVSSTSVPICIFATLGIMYFIGFELNTVTLAALIAVLGMIVDDSVVVIDGYTDLLQAGHSRWYAAAVSTTKLAVSMLFATLSIAMMFFPAIIILKGNMMGDFVGLFPWTILIALACSFIYAVQVIPFLSSRLIKRQQANRRPSAFERAQNSFFDWLLRGYQRLLSFCFRHKKLTLVNGGLFTLLGAFLFTQVNIQILPKAERDSFAVEIHLAASSSIEETEAVADSLARLLKKDPRIVSITSFVGMSSPRFHMTYAPQLPSDSYAQFIVNTTGNDETKALMAEYAQRYENIFPQAQIRFKQMDYQATPSPVEFYITGDNYESLLPVRDTLLRLMKENQKLYYVHSDFDGTEEMVDVVLRTDDANRMGITQSALSLFLSGALSGTSLATMWEGDYDIQVKMKTEDADQATKADILDELIPIGLTAAIPTSLDELMSLHSASEAIPSVPLRQFADIVPTWQYGQICHRNGLRTVTVQAEVARDKNVGFVTDDIMKFLETFQLPEGMQIEIGGQYEDDNETTPLIIGALIISIAIIFFVLLWHFRKVSEAVLIMVCLSLCVFGTAMGILLGGVPVSLTAVLGFVSLMGILVRNGVILFDYAAEVRELEHLTLKDAIHVAAERRMRPIFLTSAAASMGVVPMVFGGSGLWSPMGCVICYGALITMFFILTIMPIAYWKVMGRSEEK